MKILHISTSDSGGAGLACVRLHKGLLSHGVDSKVLVLCKEGDEEGVYLYKKPLRGNSLLLEKLLSWVFLIPRRLKIPLSRAQYYRYRLERLSRGSGLFFTLPFSDHDITCHPLVKEADVIHLHWVANFLDYPSFFGKMNKPVVWTVHDENLYMGGFHYAGMRNRDRTLDSFDDELAEVKKRSVARYRDITIVSLSRMMLRTSLSYEITAGKRHVVIHNPVDHTLFKPADRFSARDSWKLPRDKKIVCFVSCALWDSRKGLKELLAALRRLDRPDVALCAIGDGKIPEGTGVESFCTGVISDQRSMSVAYSACDLFIMPSFQEAFAQAPLEALSCGLPVVAFPCSGTEELINERNGIRVADFTVDSLAEGIQKALATSYDREWIRNDVINRFGIDKIVSQYIDLYREVLQKGRDVV